MNKNLIAYSYDLEKLEQHLKRTSKYLQVEFEVENRLIYTITELILVLLCGTIAGFSLFSIYFYYSKKKENELNSSFYSFLKKNLNRVTNPRIKMNKINQIKNLKKRTVKVIASGRNMNSPKKIAIAINIEKTIKSLITLLLFNFYIRKWLTSF